MCDRISASRWSSGLAAKPSAEGLDSGSGYWVDKLVPSGCMGLPERLTLSGSHANVSAPVRPRFPPRNRGRCRCDCSTGTRGFTSLRVRCRPVPGFSQEPRLPSEPLPDGRQLNDPVCRHRGLPAAQQHVAETEARKRAAKAVPGRSAHDDGAVARVGFGVVLAELLHRAPVLAVSPSRQNSIRAPVPRLPATIGPV